MTVTIAVTVTTSATSRHKEIRHKKKREKERIRVLLVKGSSPDKCTQFVVTYLGKESINLGYNWLYNHNLEFNWKTKEVKMSCCPL
jgi:hypothetical protein